MGRRGRAATYAGRRCGVRTPGSSATDAGRAASQPGPGRPAAASRPRRSGAPSRHGRFGMVRLRDLLPLRHDLPPCREQAWNVLPIASGRRVEHDGHYRSAAYHPPRLVGAAARATGRVRAVSAARATRPQGQLVGWSLRAAAISTTFQPHWTRRVRLYACCPRVLNLAKMLDSTGSRPACIQSP